jgi:hypothetical protein
MVPNDGGGVPLRVLLTPTLSLRERELTGPLSVRINESHMLLWMNAK